MVFDQIINLTEDIELLEFEWWVKTAKEKRSPVFFKCLKWYFHW